MRFLTTTGPVTRFASILHLDEGNALCIYKAICSQFQAWNIKLEKLVGFGSDGAAVMWRYAALTFILHDIIGALSSLSKKFQQDNLPLTRLLSIVESVKEELKACYLEKQIKEISCHQTI